MVFPSTKTPYFSYPHFRNLNKFQFWSKICRWNTVSSVKSNCSKKTWLKREITAIKSSLTVTDWKAWYHDICFMHDVFQANIQNLVRIACYDYYKILQCIMRRIYEIPKGVISINEHNIFWFLSHFQIEILTIFFFCN